GAVYVFHRAGTTWTQEAYIKAPEAKSSNDFGRGIALWGDTLVSLSLEGGTSTVEWAHVYVRSGGAWSFQASLPIPLGAWNSVALWKNTLVIGGADPNKSAPSESGAVYVFKRTNDHWNQQIVLISPRPTAQGGFGSSV